MINFLIILYHTACYVVRHQFWRLDVGWTSSFQSSLRSVFRSRLAADLASHPVASNNYVLSPYHSRSSLWRLILNASLHYHFFQTFSRASHYMPKYLSLWSRNLNNYVRLDVKLFADLLRIVDWSRKFYDLYSTYLFSEVVFGDRVPPQSRHITVAGPAYRRQD